MNLRALSPFKKGARSHNVVSVTEEKKERKKKRREIKATRDLVGTKETDNIFGK